MTYPSWHVTELTPDAAMAHDRRVHNCGPDVRLGWTPYTHRVTHGAIAQWATIGEQDFERQLAARRLRVIRWSPWSGGVRSAFLEEVPVNV